MSSQNNANQHRDLASCLIQDLLRAILEAGSYEPNNAAPPPDRPCGYEIDFGNDEGPPVEQT
jgi:hypothetical protein